MPKFVDLTNKVFGKLLVIERAENANNRVMWLCRCECGNTKIIRGSSLTTGATTSCGCMMINNNPKPRGTVNTYDLSGEYGIGYTSKGEEFYFDLEDYDMISKYSWYILPDGYVSTNAKNTETGKQSKIAMHRLVMGVTDKNQLVDHIYHVKVDNRKSQLRLVTPLQNTQNHVPYYNRDCPTGVYHYKDKWRVGIGINNRIEWLGIFDKLEDAISAREQAEIKYFGSYRYVSSPNMGE